MLKSGRPSIAKKVSLSISDVKDEKIRLSLDINKELHKKIKMRAVEDDITVKDLITQILEKAFMKF